MILLSCIRLFVCYVCVSSTFFFVNPFTAILAARKTANKNAKCEIIKVTLAMSTFSPVGSRSSNGMRMCVRACVRACVRICVCV